MSEMNEAIVLVDDNNAHRRLVKRALKKAGFDFIVLEAGGLEEARKMLFSAPLSEELLLAVVDMNLGDGRGTALMSELKQRMKLPIIAISTSGLDIDRKDSYGAGADCFITKSDESAEFARDIAEGIKVLLSR